jgi:hypothetical protein
MNITINLLEAASELAHESMIESMLRSNNIMSPDEVYLIDGSGDTYYTDSAQDVFNKHYDYFFNQLNRLSI